MLADLRWEPLVVSAVAASLEHMLDLVLALAKRTAPETTEELARAIDAYHHYRELG